MKHRTIIIAGTSAAAALLSAALPLSRVLVWNATASVPTGLYHIRGKASLHVGERVAIVGRHPAPIGGLDGKDFVQGHRGDLQQFFLGIADRCVGADRIDHIADEERDAWAYGLGIGKAHLLEGRIEAEIGLIASKHAHGLALRPVEQRAHQRR